MGYAQEVHEAVCFRPEDVQQEVQLQFGSEPAKTQSFKLGKDTLRLIKTNRDVMDTTNIIGKQGKKSMAFQVLCLARKRKLIEHRIIPLLDVLLAILHQ